MDLRISSLDKEPPPLAVKFLDSYEKTDLHIYFGREKETKALYQKVKESRLVVLYGLSGTGKTSLVQCGLANEFSESDWQDIVIRRGGYPSIIDAISDAFKELSPNIHYVGPVLIETLRQIYLENLKPIYLIFDQFEELFINGNEREIRRTISFISDILSDAALPVTIIFSLREEYFAHLDKFERKIPSIYDNKLRLERMSRATVEFVIKRISEESGIELMPDVTSLIINNIENKKTQTVELPYLQVYLKKLFTRLNAIRRVTITDVSTTGKLEDVLSDFLEEQVHGIAESENIEQEKIWGVLKNMITYEGTKKAVTLGHLQRNNINPGSVPPIVDCLVDVKIIQQQNHFLELKHDSLAMKINSKRTADEKAVIDAYRILRNVKAAEGELTEDQLNKIIPQKEALREMVTNEAEFNDLLGFLQTNEKKIAFAKHRAWLRETIMKLLAIVLLLFIVITVASSGIREYKRLLDGARIAAQNKQFQRADELYYQALNKPWCLAVRSITRERDSVARQADNYMKGDLLFQRGQIYLEKSDKLDSAYILISQALSYKQDTVFSLRLEFARERIREKIAALEKEILILKKPGIWVGRPHVRERERIVNDLKALINDEK